MKKNQDNKVHVHGLISCVTPANNTEGKPAFFINLATRESYKEKNAEGKEEWKDRFTHHNVSVVTDDAAVIEQLNSIGDDCATNAANKNVEGYKYKAHEASFDGILITREKEKDGVKFYNQLILADNETMKLDCKQEEKEVRNTASIKGNIAHIDNKGDFAIIQIGTRYYAPGEAVNYKGETKPYHEETSYVETRISKNFRPETFAKIESGEIAVGDLVKVRGQMHNNNFTDKNDVNRYKIVVDINSIEVVAKKKAVEAEVKETAPKEAPKAKKATRRQKGQSL